MTNKKFNRRKPAIQTSAWQMPKINFDGIAHASRSLLRVRRLKMLLQRQNGFEQPAKEYSVQVSLVP